MKEKAMNNAVNRAVANEKKRAASAAENAPKMLTENQRRDRFGKLNGVGVVPVIGENGVTGGYTVGLLVSKVSAGGRERRAMVTLQEALEGASIYAADFNRWTRRVYATRTAAIVAAAKFAKYAGLDLLPAESAELPKAEKAEKKAADAAKAERESAKAAKAAAIKAADDAAKADAEIDWKARAERAERLVAEKETQRANWQERAEKAEKEVARLTAIIRANNAG